MFDHLLLHKTKHGRILKFDFDDNTSLMYLSLNYILVPCAVYTLQRFKSQKILSYHTTTDIAKQTPSFCSASYSLIIIQGSVSLWGVVRQPYHHRKDHFSNFDDDAGRFCPQKQSFQSVCEWMSWQKDTGMYQEIKKVFQTVDTVCNMVFRKYHEIECEMNCCEHL